jgi:drug/metabolite transporter (DMT)-like permease
MRPRDTAELTILAAIWGASFLLMRVAVPEFGPGPLIAVRVAVAAAVLVPLWLLQGGLGALWAHKGRLLLLGALMSALPFVLYAFAATRLPAGYASILSASTPLWGALVAATWLKERLPAASLAGLGLGFAGVVLLVAGRASFTLGGAAAAIAACLLASLSYGISANFTKRYGAGIHPLGLATGSQLGATVTLAPVALATWPAATPSLQSWAAVLLLGVLCTGVAYILYFRLIRNAGPARAMSVTYVVPVFGMLWGWLFLGEQVTVPMILGTVVILAGVGLTTGALRVPQLRAGIGYPSACDVGEQACRIAGSAAHAMQKRRTTAQG